jgi:hypothetical protein
VYAGIKGVCMPRLSASLLILFAVALTFGQTPSNLLALKNGDISIGPAANSECPIGFSASRQANGQILNRASDAKQAGSAQGLHLMLNHLSKPAIQSIEVTVYASSLKLRALPLPLDASLPETISKTFSLERQTGAASLSDADVWMHQVGSVRWADLISITFTDGTTWHPTENLKCRAVPSNFLLVGSR